jgi:transcriptional regulator with XRE-family HTH domain
MSRVAKGPGGLATADQIRMAGAALRWTSAELGERAGLSRNTVNAIERGDATMVPTMLKLRAVLEQAGVAFLDDDGPEPGVGIAPRIIAVRVAAYRG